MVLQELEDAILQVVACLESTSLDASLYFLSSGGRDVCFITNHQEQALFHPQKINHFYFFVDIPPGCKELHPTLKLQPVETVFLSSSPSLQVFYHIINSMVVLMKLMQPYLLRNREPHIPCLYYFLFSLKNGCISEAEGLCGMKASVCFPSKRGTVLLLGLIK